MRQANLPLNDDETLNFSWLDFIRAIYFLLGSRRKAFLGWSTLLLICQTFALVPPYIIGQIVDFFTTYQAGDDLTLFYFLALGLGAIMAIVAILRLTGKNKINTIAFDTVYQTKVDGFERLMDFSIEWHQQENTGNKVQRILAGTGSIRSIIWSINKDVLNIIVATFGITTLFLLLNPIYALIFIAYITGLVCIQVYFYRKLQRANQQYLISSEKSSGTYFESASNILTIKSLGAKHSVKKNVDDNEKAARDQEIMQRNIDTRKWQVFQIMNAVTITGFVLLLGHQTAAGLITSGSIFVYFTYLLRLVGSAGDSLSLSRDVIEQKNAIGRMMPIFWEQPQAVSGTKNFPANWHQLTIRDASFSYASQQSKHAITNLDISIARGQKIGIVGHSGSGKSTLAKLLLGMYHLSSGSISFDNIELQHIKHESLTKHVSTVLQETELFNLSLKDNVTMMKDVPENAVKAALSLAQVNDLVDKLPQGIDTQIGEKGYRLSGGERQRLGIARAICSGAELLILDEATSALDSKTEALIQAGLEKELQDRTMIIIAHRLSTLKHVDHIVVFDQGSIVEQGTFNQLANHKSSIFAQLLKQQEHQTKP